MGDARRHADAREARSRHHQRIRGADFAAIGKPLLVAAVELCDPRVGGASAIALLRVPIRKPCPDTRSPLERDQRLQRLALLPDAMDRIQLLDISGISNGNHRACAWSPTLHGDLGLSLPGFTPACLEG